MGKEFKDAVKTRPGYPGNYARKPDAAPIEGVYSGPKMAEAQKIRENEDELIAAEAEEEHGSRRFAARLRSAALSKASDRRTPWQTHRTTSAALDIQESTTTAVPGRQPRYSAPGRADQMRIQPLPAQPRRNQQERCSSFRASFSVCNWHRCYFSRQSGRNRGLSRLRRLDPDIDDRSRRIRHCRVPQQRQMCRGN